VQERRRARFKLSPKIILCVEEVPASYTAALGFFVGCGARHEPPALWGVTHLCEHLFYKKTSTKTAVDISRISERLGGDFNAYTDRELTCFHADCPVEQFDEMFSLILELLLDPRFERADFESERDVVVQEIVAYEDNPEDVFSDLSLEVPWKRHPLGLRIGATSEQVGHLSFESTYHYLENTFLQAPWVISVVSPMRIAAVKKAIDSHLKNVANFRFASALRKSVQPRRPARVASLTRPFSKRSECHTIDSEQVQVAFSFPGLPLKHRDEVQLSALMSLLGVGASSLLYRELREEAGLVYHVSSAHHSFSDSGLMMGQWACSKESLSKAAYLAGSVCGRLSRDVCSEEINYTRQCLEGATKMSFDGIRGRMESMGRQELLLGRSYDLPQTLAELRKIRKPSIDRYAKVLGKAPCFLMVGPLGKREMKQLESSWCRGRDEALGSRAHKRRK
jgi:predicted Zn-dependent peptidase